MQVQDKEVTEDDTTPNHLMHSRPTLPSVVIDLIKYLTPDILVRWETIFEPELQYPIEQQMVFCSCKGFFVYHKLYS